MAQCLHPRYIKVDKRSKCVIPSVRDVRYKDVRPHVIEYIPVPCGKCINCLRNRQNAMVSRCLFEADKRASFYFVTLTYEDKFLPVAQSLWRVSKDSGEYERVSEYELVSTSGDELFVDRARLLEAVGEFKSPKPVYLESVIPAFEDDEYIYLSRLTPSVNRRDVRLWLKRSRVRYEREHGFKLSPFSYVAVSEYGPNTCRPHYHLAFFGLNRLEVDWLCQQWKMGFYIYKCVNKVNPDGTDGFQIASRYIGKYITKGKFDCDSVLDKSAEKPRICQSLGIGSCMLDKLRPSLCAFDMYGEYDLDTLFCPSLGRCFNQSEIDSLCNEIPKRFYFDSMYGYKLPVPRSIRDKVFCHTKIVKKFKKFPVDKVDLQAVRVPTTLWKLVSASIREYLSVDASDKFLRYLERYDKGQIPLAVCEFASYEDSCTEISESSHEENYINFLQSSIF